jgi:hypothetical protein
VDGIHAIAGRLADLLELLVGLVPPPPEVQLIDEVHPQEVDGTHP